MVNDAAVNNLKERYFRIQERIAAATAPHSRANPPVLIAVSKKQSADQIEALYRLGHRDFGENYVQEMVEKAAELETRRCPGIRWHFIGHLQTNKVKALMPYVHTVHSVDSFKLAVELARRWTAHCSETGDSSTVSRALPVFLEVNISAEESKSGLAPLAVPDLALQLLPQQELELQGLMCVPAAGLEPEALRSAFSGMRDLEFRCRPASRGRLSMGMSDDFEIALQEGATHIRVGTALFGERKN